MRAFILFAGLLLSFNILFWEQGSGINLPIFGWIICALIYAKQRPTLNKLHWFLITGSLLTGLFSVIWHTNLSILVFVITSISLGASFRFQSISVFESFLNGMVNFINPTEGVIPGYTPAPAFKQKKGLIILRVAAFPLVIFFLYMLLFSAGNSIFNSFAGDFLMQVSSLFQDLSFPHFMFLVLGAVIIRWAMRKKIHWGLHMENSDFLSRNSKQKRRFKQHPMALKYEFLRGIVLFGSLNALFLVINFIDVKWVWFGFSITDGFDLKSFVHEGTGYLLASLILSIVLVLYFFRQNLNFFPKNVWLKRLAYIWIFQNAILTISVFIRTIHYINFHGLASLRIGLMVFLTMVLFGLVTLVIKINKKRNLAYIIRMNSAFILGALIISACFPWNRIIVSHNLAHGNINEIDVNNYLNVGPLVYAMIYNNLDIIERQIVAHQNNKQRWISYSDIEEFKKVLDARTDVFMNAERNEKIWSWNLADENALKELGDMKS